MTWQSELGHPTFEPFFAGYSDDGIAKLTCSAGHKTFHLIQSTKFENLMESEADANQVMIKGVAAYLQAMRDAIRNMDLPEGG
jgi:hypothetical protein